MSADTRPTTFRDVVWVAICLLVLFLGCAILTTATSSRGIDVKESKAQLGCARLAQAIERYLESDANKKPEPPATLRDLLKPPFGGKSFLRNGEEAELIDPWDNPYQMEVIKRADGDEFFLVFTMTPDGTPISQFGIGENVHTGRDQNSRSIIENPPCLAHRQELVSLVASS